MSASHRVGMKIGKWLAIAAVAYVGVVVAFELYLGVGQPTMARLPIPILVLTTTDESGQSHERRLARMDSGGRLYVSAHHWPRAWHRRALENPDVRVAFDDGTGGAYRAVPVDGEEYERVAAEFPIPLPIRFLMGFPPRDLLRLEPRSLGRD